MLASDNLRHERETRLLRLLTIKAPSSVIEQECRLVLKSYHGSHLRVILWMTQVLVGNKWDRYLDSAQFYAHYLAGRCGFHWRFRDVTEPGACWVCEALDYQTEWPDDF